MLRAPGDLCALRLEPRLGVAATGLDMADRTVRLADGSSLPYDALVIATGYARAGCPAREHTCCAPWTTP